MYSANKAGGVPEIIKVLNLIGAAREKSRTNASGNYSETIAEYEHILKFSLRLSSGVDDKIGRKFEELRSKLQTELKILYDIQRELTSISSVPVRQKTGQSRSDVGGETDDPDVWPPPTPQDGGRRPDAYNRRPDTSERNLPSWARMRDYDENRKNQLVSRAPVPVQRAARQPASYAAPRGGDESSAARAERLRKERDASIPSNRKRTSSSAQQPPSRNVVDQSARGRNAGANGRNAPRTSAGAIPGVYSVYSLV